MCGERSGKKMVAVHHPGGCCTLVVDEVSFPLIMKSALSTSVGRKVLYTVNPIHFYINLCHDFCQKLLPLLVGAVLGGQLHRSSSHHWSIFHFPLVLSCLPTHLVSIPFITCCVFNPLFPLMSLSEIVLCQCCVCCIGARRVLVPMFIYVCTY